MQTSGVKIGTSEGLMSDRSDIAFIRAELRTGLTMAEIALNTRRSDKKERTRLQARKAYDAIQRFAPPINFGPYADEIAVELGKLRNCLLKLGEDI